MERKKLKVLLVDDHVVLLKGLRLLLENTADLQVIGEAINGENALELCKNCRPDVVVLDINLGEYDGFDLIPKIKAIIPEVNILLLTMYAEEDFLKKALQLGAKGYILKKSSDKELLTAIRAVGNGKTFLEPSLAESLVNLALRNNNQQKFERHPKKELTSREREILGLVALGYTNQQIAKELVISKKTVETHKANIKTKLGIKMRSELVKYAMENDLLPKK